ncbi:MAG: polyprenyl synthetase family protein [Corynebacterium sp.]|nr:polyprenyl synthetase family protein [Corynebacterium sp.]
MHSIQAAEQVIAKGAASSSADITACFESFPQDITTSMDAFLTGQLATLEAIGSPVTFAGEQLRDFVLGGGKRIRPRCAWAGYLTAIVAGTKDTSPAPAAAVLPTIASLELIQACALIHDDIIDASDTRRGKPTIHRVTEEQHRTHAWQGDSAHYGESVAILVGDLATVWADDMFHNSGADACSLQRASQAWRGMRTEVIGGQLLDIALEVSGIASSEYSAEEFRALTYNVNRFKTAAYTIERPLHIGAALAGGSAELIAALRTYGTHLGIAFQLRDDLLGVFGDPAITGKPAGDDLREGKVTQLITTALELSATDVDTQEVIRTQLGTISEPAELAALADIITATGAVETIEAEITRHTEVALGAIAGLEIHGMYAVLEDLATQATARKH